MGMNDIHEPMWSLQSVWILWPERANIFFHYVLLILAAAWPISFSPLVAIFSETLHRQSWHWVFIRHPEWQRMHGSSFPMAPPISLTQKENICIIECRRDQNGKDHPSLCSIIQHTQTIQTQQQSFQIEPFIFLIVESLAGKCSSSYSAKKQV